MLRKSVCLAAALVAVAAPATAFAAVVKDCSASFTASGQRLFAEARRQGDGPVTTTMRIRLPLATSAAPGGKLVEEPQLSEFLPRYGVNGEMSFLIAPAAQMKGYYATLNIGDGWSISDVTMTLPMADLGKAGRVANLRVVVAGQTFYSGFRERLDLDEATPASIVRPGLSSVGVGPDHAKLLAALRKAPEAELQGVDKAGKVLVSARFRADRLEALFTRGREVTPRLETIAAGSGACPDIEADLDS